MIGLNYLGRMGQLGNQMFQYAALRGIAAKRGYGYTIPDHNERIKDSLGNILRIELFDVFDIHPEQTGYLLADGVRSEVDFHFDEDILENCPDNVTLVGYFQTEKYFKHIEDEIRSDFDFHDELLIPAKDISSQWREPIALHIRRTDYLTNPNHSELPMPYYEKALTEFDKNRDVIIFSDDPDWCMANQLFDSDRFMVSQTENNHMDLCLMSLCKDHIIANSSFSWWGAWLGKNNQVIAPKNWFLGSNNHHLNVSDLIPDNWKKI